MACDPELQDKIKETHSIVKDTIIILSNDKNQVIKTRGNSMVDDVNMRDRIIETHTDVKHILKSLSEGRETILDHDKRIRSVEKQLQKNNGKIIVITLLIIGLITIVVNLSMRG